MPDEKAQIEWFRPEMVEFIAHDPDPVRTIMRFSRMTRGDDRPVMRLECVPAHVSLKDVRVATDREAEEYVTKLVKRGHLGVLEHVLVSAIVRCSRVCSHQFVRHRVGCSYLQESQRHAEPSGCVKGPLTSGALSEKHQAEIVCACTEAFARYNELVAEGCPKEAARYVLPGATLTEFTATMTLMAWRHFVDQRLRKEAQAEIRVLARQVYGFLHDYCPPAVVGLTDLCLEGC